MNIKELAAEFIGTLGLVLGGCGAAVLAADFGTGPNGSSLGLGYLRSKGNAASRNIRLKFLTRDFHTSANSRV